MPCLSYTAQALVRVTAKRAYRLDVYHADVEKQGAAGAWAATPPRAPRSLRAVRNRHFGEDSVALTGIAHLKQIKSIVSSRIAARWHGDSGMPMGASPRVPLHHRKFALMVRSVGACETTRCPNGSRALRIGMPIHS